MADPAAGAPGDGPIDQRRFIAVVQEAAGLDPTQAERATHAVLQTLAERLSDEFAAVAARP
jgi:uncharacterized protein (DUF2267 family)